MRKFATQDTLGTIAGLYRDFGRVWVNCHNDTASYALFDYQTLKGLPQFIAQFPASAKTQLAQWYQQGGVLLQRIECDPALRCDAVVLLTFPISPHDFKRAATRTSDLIVVSRPAVTWALIEREMDFRYPSAEQAQLLYADMQACLKEGLTDQHKLVVRALGLDPNAYIIVNQREVMGRTRLPEAVQSRLYNNHNNFTRGMVSRPFRLVRLLRRPSNGLLQEAYDMVGYAPSAGPLKVLDRDYPVSRGQLRDLQRMGSVYCYELLHCRPVPAVAPAYNRIQAQHLRELALFHAWREEIRSWPLYEATHPLPACAPAACSDA